MSMPLKPFPFISVVCLSFMLTACGGGGISTSDPDSTVRPIPDTQAISSDIPLVYSGPVAALTAPVTPLDYYSIPQVATAPEPIRELPEVSRMLGGDSRGEIDLTGLCSIGQEILVQAGFIILAELCAANSNRLVIGNLALDTPLSKDLVGTRIDVYRVPADSQVILKRLAGNPNLAIIDGLGRDARVTCLDRSPFIQDVCGVPADVQLWYVAVLNEPGVDSRYEITVTRDCSVAATNRWAYTNMQDYYLFYDQVPAVDPQAFASTRELVEAVRVERFSSVAVQRQLAQLFDEGRSFGLGLNFLTDADGTVRVSWVAPRSPAGLADVKRGDIPLAINGLDFNSLSFEQLIAEIQENSGTSEWMFVEASSGNERTVSLTQAEFPLDTVLFSTVLRPEQYEGSIGYMVFNGFLNTSAAELDRTIGEFKSAGISDLILDLRYNLGGRISIANKLSSQIVDESLVGTPLYQFVYNDKYQDLNFGFSFGEQAEQLGLERVVILTTGSTASASEIVINALKPYIDVVTVGDTTLGKPYISGARAYCGLALNAMEAEGVNAAGVSVGEGIAADCVASDDLSQDFGVVNGRLEGLAGAGLNYLVNGQCGAAFASRSDSGFGSKASIAAQLPGRNLF